LNKFSVQSLLENYSIEATVLQAQKIVRFADIVPPGKRIYVPHTPHSSITEMVELAVRLRREQVEPVPHVVARRFETLPELDEFLRQLAGKAGVTQVLIVAGDIARPAGQVQNTLQILESGLLQKHGIRTIGVAGHPEGHRDVSDTVLRDALRRKNSYAAQTGVGVYIVTQFVFTASPVIAWEASHGGDIGRLPITIGLPGLANAKTLLKYAMECGVGASLQAFSKRYATLTKLLTVSAPDESIVALARHRESNPQTRISGVHFFTFGGFEKTAAWANKIAAGEFEITDSGGLNVRG
jgi:methylenetetrahydrofolate reductase (NADPH)